MKGKKGSSGVMMFISGALTAVGFIGAISRKGRKNVQGKSESQKKPSKEISDKTELSNYSTKYGLKDEGSSPTNSALGGSLAELNEGAPIFLKEKKGEEDNLRFVEATTGQDSKHMEPMVETGKSYEESLDSDIFEGTSFLTEEMKDFMKDVEEDVEEHIEEHIEVPAASILADSENDEKLEYEIETESNGETQIVSEEAKKEIYDYTEIWDFSDAPVDEDNEEEIQGLAANINQEVLSHDEMTLDIDEEGDEEEDRIDSATLPSDQREKIYDFSENLSELNENDGFQYDSEEISEEPSSTEDTLEGPDEENLFKTSRYSAQADALFMEYANSQYDPQEQNEEPEEVSDFSAEQKEYGMEAENSFIGDFPDETAFESSALIQEDSEAEIEEAYERTKDIQFTVYGVNQKNDEGENIQGLIRKELVLPEINVLKPAYGGLKNMDVYDKLMAGEEVREVDDITGRHDITLSKERGSSKVSGPIKVVHDRAGHIGYVPSVSISDVSKFLEENPDYGLEWKLLGGKFKEIDQDKQKVRINSQSYGIEIRLFKKN